jgi:hypothetical protein
MLFTGSSASKVYLGSTAVSAVYLGSTLIYKSTPELTTFSTAGAFTYTIPTWCNTLDIICLGGGEAGGVAWLLGTGSGGKAGGWGSSTLTRGSNIPFSTATLAVTVGAGGTGSQGNWPAPGGDGQASTVSGTWGTVTGAGGAGGNSSNYNGGSPGTVTVAGQTYSGGVFPAAPGTGGGGGNPPGGPGGVGERGRVWIRAY